MPIFRDKDNVYNGIKQYLEKEYITPIEKKTLTEAMQILLSYDSDIKWIGIYAGKEKINYVLFTGEDSMIEMTEEFPFFPELAEKESGKHILASKYVKHKNKEKRYFALCGDASVAYEGSKLIMGYSTEEFEMAYKKMEDIQNTDFYITNDNGVVWSSNGEVEEKELNRTTSGIVRDEEGKLMYLRYFDVDSKLYKVYCLIPLKELVLMSSVVSIYIIPLLLLFMIGFLVVCKWAEKQFQEKIEQEYALRIRQKEAELSELQSKFNPHFLYNSLEAIRGRVLENGDNETADIIVMLAQIFRNFIGGNLFVSILEEFEFCNRYLELLEHRDDNSVKVRYDLDSEIMQCGIMRNLLQPILENYFIHGIKADGMDNRLTLRGLRDGKYIVFIVEDNGFGISEEKLKKIVQRIENTESSKDKDSYGLRSVHKRIQLFYGPDCGLEIKNNESGGVTVETRILMLSLEAHEDWMKNRF